jgi:hypothetical protein
MSNNDGIKGAADRSMEITGHSTPFSMAETTAVGSVETGDNVDDSIKAHTADESVAKSTLASRETQPTSRLLHLEPPPVVRRPPKLKTDSFSVASVPWLSWNWSEQKDLMPCARSIHKSYHETTTITFFSIKFSRDTVYRTSEHGIDHAQQIVRFGNSQWVRDKTKRARQRVFGYRGNDGEDEPGRPAGDENATPPSQEPDGDGPTDVEGQKISRRKYPGGAHPWLHDHYYVVVGLMGDESVPKETLRRVMDPDGLFKEIGRAHRHLRNPIRRIMSLKEASGFSIYECDPKQGYHKQVEVDAETERALIELWRNYRSHNLDYGGRWLMWIHHNFNNGSKNPEHGKLTLEFKLRWSVTKVVFWGVVPVLLSLAIGFWYMYKDHGEIDDVAVAEAAWVIASYIVTTSACKGVVYKFGLLLLTRL